MVNFTKFIVFAALSQALSIKERDVNTVLPSLKTIDADTTDYAKAINAYTGGQPSTVTAKYQKLDQDLATLADDTNRVQQYTEAQAAAICDYANKTLAPDTQIMLNTLIAKKKLVISQGYQSTISSQLQQLQYHTNSVFSGGIIRNSPNGQQAACSAAVGTINQGYNSAQKAYAN